jgi:hypothetical protein
MIGDAPAGPERSGGRCRSDFLGSREEWAKPRGRKSQATALRFRRSRRSRSSARSSHHRGPVRRVLKCNYGERWLISVVPYKGSERLGVEKETGCGKCRHRWRDRPSTETFLPRPMELDFRQPVEVLWKTIAFFRSGPEHPHADPIRTSSTTRVGRSLFACGGRENWERNVVDRPAPSDRSGLREDGQTRPCCAADEERPEASEDLPPRKRRHADLRHGENDMIASKCSRQSKQGRDDGPQDQRPGHGERDLSDRQRHAAGDDGN